MKTFHVTLAGKVRQEIHKYARVNMLGNKGKNSLDFQPFNTGQYVSGT